ncbi:MAG TPA: DUF5615 family PIN-like protein [Acidobacteriota bacterium]|nr:DUF5615 family PIN-like protein [Acidobacteriota bacterium]
MRLYIDEDSMSKALVQALRQQGFDVLTAQEAGLRGEDDKVQLAHATRQDRVFFTYNVRDFSRLHQEYWQTGQEQHAGIITCRQTVLSFSQQWRAMVELRKSLGENLRGQLVFLNQFFLG